MPHRMGPDAGDLPRGLEGVEVATTELGDVRGEEGFFHLRGFDAIELARRRTLEDVWYLLYEGRLPDMSDRAAFMEEVRPLRAIPADVRELLPQLVKLGEGSEPLQALRAAYALFACGRGFKPFVEVTRQELRAQAVASCSVFPTLIAALHRLARGLEPIDPHPSLPWAANYLFMLTGEEPAPERAGALEKYLMATVDHGFNSSTFTARVITSTGADLASAVLGGLGALSGPLHGGAPSRALDMLDEIGSVENADRWLRDAVLSGKRLMGFGHRVYRTDDPRSLMLRDIADGLDRDGAALAKHVEKRAVAILKELKPGRALYPNVEFYAGIVLDMIGIPRSLFTPTFATSRIIGWTAHILEQAADNRLFRPAARYTGPEAPQMVPLAE